MKSVEKYNFDSNDITEEINNQQSENDTGRSRARKKKKGFGSFLKTLLLVLVLIAVGIEAYSFAVTYNNHYTVAIFGLDSRNGNLGKEALSDVNIIADVNGKTGEIKLVSVYRDTYSAISAEGKYHKFNEAYFRGGADQALWAVENNLDLEIDDYAAFNWSSVVNVINIMGGVDIEITDREFKYINSYITETVESTGIGSYQLEAPGLQHLDGVQAVAYARLRKMDDDFCRTERQRTVISKLMEKAKHASPKTLYEVAAVVFGQTNTSVNLLDLLPYAATIWRWKLGETSGFPFDLTTMNIGELDCVIPVTMQSNVIKLHEFLYPEESYTPSQTVQNISGHISDKTGLY